jgi:hypothetical protein
LKTELKLLNNLINLFGKGWLLKNNFIRALFRSRESIGKNDIILYSIFYDLRPCSLLSFISVFLVMAFQYPQYREKVGQLCPIPGRGAHSQHFWGGEQIFWDSLSWVSILIIIIIKYLFKLHNSRQLTTR